MAVTAADMVTGREEVKDYAKALARWFQKRPPPYKGGRGDYPLLPSGRFAAVTGIGQSLGARMA